MVRTSPLGQADVGRAHPGTSKNAFRALVRLSLALAVAVLGLGLVSYPVRSQTVDPRGNLSPEAAQQAPALPNFVDLVKAVQPAVVSVRVKSELPARTLSDKGLSPFEGTPFEDFFNFPDQTKPFSGRPRFEYGQGSGFFISADGYIVTNHHVIADAKNVEMVTEDGAVLNAKVVGTDEKTDLALVKVEDRTDFPFVKFADLTPNIAPGSQIEGAGSKGLAVLQVEPGGVAAKVGLAAGDVTVRAGGQEVYDVRDSTWPLSAAAAKGKSNVLVLVRRGDDQRYVALPTSSGEGANAQYRLLQKTHASCRMWRDVLVHR